MTNTAQFMKC